MSKQLKVVMSDRLRSIGLTLSSMKTVSGELQVVATTRRELVDTVNNFLQQVQTSYVLQVYFSTKSNVVANNGLFKEKGTTGMLETKYYEAVDYAPPFIAALFD